MIRTVTTASTQRTRAGGGMGPNGAPQTSQEEASSFAIRIAFETLLSHGLP